MRIWSLDKPASGGSLLIRRGAAGDEQAVRALLGDLQRSYPGATAWMERTWADVLDGGADCRVAESMGTVVGVAIDKPRPGGSRKLCSIYVAEAARGTGIGEALVRSVLSSWIAQDVKSGRVTCRRGKLPELRRLLIKCGFAYNETHVGRYGPGQDEDIFEWRPTTHGGDGTTSALRRSDIPWHQGRGIPAGAHSS